MEPIESRARSCFLGIGRQFAKNPERSWKALFLTLGAAHLFGLLALHRSGASTTLSLQEVCILGGPSLASVVVYPVDGLIQWPPCHRKEDLPKQGMRFGLFFLLDQGAAVGMRIWMIRNIAGTSLVEWGQRLQNLTDPVRHWMDGSRFMLSFFTVAAIEASVMVWTIKPSGNNEEEEVPAQPVLATQLVLSLAADAIYQTKQQELRAVHEKIAEEITLQRPIAAQLNEKRLAKSPPKLDLPDTTCTVEQWKAIYNGTTDHNARLQRLMSALQTLHDDKSGLAEFRHSNKGRLDMRFHQLGAELAKIDDVERKQFYLDWLNDALVTCQTSWDSEIDAILRDIVSGGRGLEWQVRQRHSDLKWELVILNIQCKLKNTDGQHWRASWSRTIGQRLGMYDPDAIDGETIYFANTENFLTAVVFNAQEMAMRILQQELIADFRLFYTPRFLVDHWKEVSSSKSDPVAKAVGQYIQQHYDGDWEGELYDTDMQLTDAGAIWFLQQMGELVPS